MLETFSGTGLLSVQAYSALLSISPLLALTHQQKLAERPNQDAYFIRRGSSCQLRYRWRVPSVTSPCRSVPLQCCTYAPCILYVWLVVIEGTVNITGCWTSTWTALLPSLAGSSSKPTSLTATTVQNGGKVTWHKALCVAAMSAAVGHTWRATTLPDVDISMPLSTSSQAAPSTLSNLCTMGLNN